MSTEIEAVSESLELDTQHIKATQYGLIIEGQPTPDEWVNVMLKLQGGETLMQWYKADLAACAESLTLGWGDSKYEELSARFDSSIATLRKLASVARRFPISFREKLVSRSRNMFSLSMSHFDATMGMSDEYAEYWLVKAAENQWGRDKFREEIVKWKIERGDINEPREEPMSFKTFKELQKNAWKDYTPMARDSFEYDKTSYWLEVRDYANEQLKELGIVDVK